MIVALIVAFAMLDCTLAGFRSAAGRDGRIRKTDYFLRAMGLGALFGICVVLALAALTAMTIWLSSEPYAVWNELIQMGTRLLIVFAAFSALVLSSLFVYSISRHELRTLATVAVLGPFTLARPAVVVFAAVWATTKASNPAAIFLTWVSSLAILCVGYALDWVYRRRHGG